MSDRFISALPIESITDEMTESRERAAQYAFRRGIEKAEAAAYQALQHEKTNRAMILDINRRLDKLEHPEPHHTDALRPDEV